MTQSSGTEKPASEAEQCDTSHWPSVPRMAQMVFRSQRQVWMARRCMASVLVELSKDVPDLVKVEQLTQDAIKNCRVDPKVNALMELIYGEDFT